LETGASPGIQHKFLRDTKLYLDAVHELVDNRAANMTLGVDDYTKLRRGTGALEICYAMGEYALGIDVPDEVLRNPLFEDMMTMAVDVVIFSNVCARGFRDSGL
jgi:hypothetical protein